MLEVSSIGDETYHRTFPFVEELDNEPVKVIKPLNLGHEEPSKIIDHGGSWLVALDVLKRRGKLPEKALFTIDGPGSSANKKRQTAFKETVERLQDTGVEVITYTESERILEFAQHS